MKSLIIIINCGCVSVIIGVNRITIVKIMKKYGKIICIQLEIVIHILFKQVPGTDSFSNVSARIWNVITANIDVNITFMQFKSVLI